MATRDASGSRGDASAVDEVFWGLRQHWPEALLGEDGYSRDVNRKVVNLMMDHFVKHYWRQVSGC